MIWLDNTTDSTDTNLSQLRETEKDSEAWPAVVHGVTKSRTRLKRLNSRIARIHWKWVTFLKES